MPELIHSINPDYADGKRGLTTFEARELLATYGPNALPEKPPPSKLSIFFSQLKNPLVYILLVAGIVTFFLKEYSDTAIISLAVFINTILGYVQESRAGEALEALKKLVHPEARVFRDGKELLIPVEELVPGDIVLLGQGDKIPADGKAIEVNRFFVSEAILTGESEAIEKTLDSDLFMGTIVTAGKARIVVTITGAKTEMGKIAASISTKEEITPLGRQLNTFSKQLTVLVLILLVAILLIGVIKGLDSIEIFTIAVALAVSAIPEGMLVGLTVVLAVGMQKILNRKGLVRNLVSAETLGGVTTICIDKTGTLTKGRMQVVDIIGNTQTIAKHVIMSDNLDTTVAVSAWDWGNKQIKKGEADQIKKFAVLDSIPFTSENKFYASLNKWNGGNKVVLLTGAPEILLEATDLSDSQKAQIYGEIEELSASGRRLLGFASKLVPNSVTDLDNINLLENLEWTGMLGFNDPIRPDVRTALAKAKKAGIRLIIITGDYANTALSVLTELGIQVHKDDVVLGADLEKMTKHDLERVLYSNGGFGTKLFARTKPEQKLKIVHTLKLHGEVVAMMGDGVNDAPALSKADIGIVVGEATEVAKESADLVLLDSSFNTIIAAIEEGRRIFDNLRKIVLYLMVDAFEGILVVISSIILGFPLPIAAIHILWINLVSDGFPHLALTVDPLSAGAMERSPRAPTEPLISRWMAWLIGIVSFSGWIFALSAFIFVLKSTEDLTLARSVAFATIGINSLIYVFSVRTLTDPFWKVNLFENKWLIAAVGLGMLFQFFPFMTPSLREFFKIEAIGYYWGLAFGSAFLMFFVIEIFKWVFRHKLKRKHASH